MKTAIPHIKATRIRIRKDKPQYTPCPHERLFENHSGRVPCLECEDCGERVDQFDNCDEPTSAVNTADI